MAKPSIFGSATNSNLGLEPNLSVIRLINCNNSCSSKTLLSDNIGCMCFTGFKLELLARPTRCVGDSGVINSGY